MMTYNYIEINPGIAGGSPVFKGTRIPLYTILDFISAGNTVEEILQHYPRLTEAHIKEAVKYASDSFKTTGQSIDDKKRDLLDLSGTWEDDRSLEEIIKEIYDSRTASQKAQKLGI